MAALPYQFTAPRRKVLGGVWRSATCVTLAIIGLLAAAMTWTPLPTAAAACAGASSSAAACRIQAQTQVSTLTAYALMADAAGINDIPHVSRITTHVEAAIHTTKKTVHTSHSYYGTATGGLPCQDTYMFVPNISQWTAPPGCYGNIYYPDRSVYHANSTFGYCNWWVLALHPNQPDILYGKEYTRSSTPVAGAAVWFDPNVQGAGSAGHWAQAVAVSPDGYWVLITEMNFSWRGGGFGRVDFRYIHVGAGVYFIH
jgi:surface antigen